MIAESRKRRPQGVIASGTGSIRPRARLIRTIGAELISSEIVAVLELVRNSYDADASRVEIRFERPHLADLATLTIQDDGHGMTRDILLGPWLEPATDYKSARGTGIFSGEYSPKGRRRLGSKGVGRFAAQRLGSYLAVRSRAIGNSSEFQADFEWNVLDNADRYLDELTVPWREVLPEPDDWHGTSLLISYLRENWTEERFERLRLALSRLLGPGLSEGFNIEIVIEGDRERIKPFVDTIPPMYSIEGEVLEGGSCTITYRDIVGNQEDWERTVVWPLADTCGPFRFRINSWDLDREALEYFFAESGVTLGLRDFRRVIRDHSGISLYRDGFRILPYGEPDNDWLRLDRRRVNNPTLRLSNNQILGWVQLSAVENPFLQDQTNREGLVTNRAYIHLQQAIVELISYLEVRRFAARRRFGSKGSIPRSSSEALGSYVGEYFENAVQQLFSFPGKSSEVVPAIRSIIATSAEKHFDAVREYLWLAGAGSMVPVIGADLLHPIAKAKAEARFLRDELELATAESSSVLPKDILVSIAKIQASLEHLSGRVDILTSVSRVGRELRFDERRLGECVESAGDLLAREFVEAQTEFVLDIEEDSPVRNPEVVLQVLPLIFLEMLEELRKSRGARVLTARIRDNKVTVSGTVGTPLKVGGSLSDAVLGSSNAVTGLRLGLAAELLKLIGGRIASSDGGAIEMEVRGG